MKTVTRDPERAADRLRPWRITTGPLEHAEGSALIEAGKTRVLCAASVEDRVPQFLKNGGKGWVTSEYSMLPRSTHTRSPRERGGKLGGRTMEIQRFIGRSLRSVTDLRALGERTITLDCDVIQADGGTRCASVTAAWVALHEAVLGLLESGRIENNPLVDSVAAVSVGVVGGALLLDLDYGEDSSADVDMNVVMTGRGKLVEVQVTAEQSPFSLSRMNQMIGLARQGILDIQRVQMDAVTGRNREG